MGFFQVPSFLFHKQHMKNMVWKHQIIITRPNLAGFKSLTAQPYVLGVNPGEQGGLFLAKAYFL